MIYETKNAKYEIIKVQNNAETDSMIDKILRNEDVDMFFDAEDSQNVIKELYESLKTLIKDYKKGTDEEEIISRFEKESKKIEDFSEAFNETHEVLKEMTSDEVQDKFISELKARADKFKTIISQAKENEKKYDKMKNDLDRMLKAVDDLNKKLYF